MKVDVLVIGCLSKRDWVGAQGAFSKIPRVPGTPDFVSIGTHLDRIGNSRGKEARRKKLGENSLT